LAPAVVAYCVVMFGVDELHLLNITVAPEWQSRGLGAQLLDEVVALCRSRGLAALWLEVRVSNLRALALYRRRGFLDRGVRRAYYPALAKREDAVVMSLDTGPRIEAAVLSTELIKAGRHGLV